MRAPRRWPLHPPPGPLESLSSWLERLARPYEISVPELLIRGLGLPAEVVPQDLDLDPPQALLAALAERTGVDPDRLRSMTLAGHVPWLFDTLTVDPAGAPTLFDAYVRDNSVLLAPGHAGRHNIASGRWRRWPGPWQSDRPLLRACRLCTHDPERGRALVWRLPLVSSCPDHRCRLENAHEIALAVLLGDGLPIAAPLEEPLALVDRYTYQALSRGRVGVPGRDVHAGVWFRMLRCLLDELSLAIPSHGTHRRTTLTTVWQAAGREPRAGLNIWRPYELLPPDRQEAMLHAAGTALRLAADHTITARGRHADALRIQPGTAVYDGDPPIPRNTFADTWQRSVTEIAVTLTHAHTDPAAARQMLIWFTQACRTLAEFAAQRALLVRLGVPQALLPDVTELGRRDLI